MSSSTPYEAQIPVIVTSLVKDLYASWSPLLGSILPCSLRTQDNEKFLQQIFRWICFHPFLRRICSRFLIDLQPQWNDREKELSALGRSWEFDTTQGQAYANLYLWVNFTLQRYWIVWSVGLEAYLRALLLPLLTLSSSISPTVGRMVVLRMARWIPQQLRMVWKKSLLIDKLRTLA